MKRCLIKTYTTAVEKLNAKAAILTLLDLIEEHKSFVVEQVANQIVCNVERAGRNFLQLPPPVQALIASRIGDKMAAELVRQAERYKRERKNARVDATLSAARQELDRLTADAAQVRERIEKLEAEKIRVS